jgi:hypothetical protein
VLGIYECDDAGRLGSFTVFDGDDLTSAMRTTSTSGISRISMCRRQNGSVSS